MRILELYAGIGGVAATGADVVAAIDHDEAAHRVYASTFAHPALRLNLASVRPNRLFGFGADVWWMSPPCQPYTVRGAQRDLEDRRAESLVHLLGVLAERRPWGVAVENVPGFLGSVAHARLRGVLAGMHVWEGLVCPSELGWPVERRRFYLVACEEPLQDGVFARETRPLAAFLDPAPDPALALDARFLDRFGGALHVVDAGDPSARAACFTSAYGRSPVYAGSYVRQDGVLRRFGPREIARLHGYPEHLALPEDLRRATKLVGNGLAVPVVAGLLGRLRARG